MKIYINKYKDHWISPITIVDYLFFWTKWSKCSRDKWIVEDKDWVDSPEWASKLADKLTPLSEAIRWVWDKIDRKIEYVKIDYWDTWSMDHTLSYIIVPMLKQLRDTKHGHPLVDDEDAPEELRSDKVEKKEDDHGWDANAEKRWDWVLNEMIWAFERKTMDDDESQFYDHTESNKIKDFMESMKALKVDREGLEKHWARKRNGYRLFGKYYEALWD
jgi:hypothetical protein